MEEMRGEVNEHPATDSRAAAADARLATKRSYSEAAQRQPAVTCVIPVRLGTLTILLLAGLALIAGVEALFVQVYQSAHTQLRVTLAPLDVMVPGSLAGWLSAVLLFVAALYSGLVFHLRRHKLDDFRGRYRVWIAAIAGLVLASLDALTGLHNALAAWLVEVSGTPLFGDGTAWWLLTIGACYFLLGLRLVVEMRESQSAVAFTLLAATGYATAAVLDLQLWPVALGRWGHGLAYSTPLLLAHLSILFAVLSYARFVYLDSQGRLRRRADEETLPQHEAVKTRAAEPATGKKARRTAASESASKQTAAPRVKKQPTIRVDSAHKSSQRSNAEEDVAGATTAADGARQTTGKMSKAERRRQRKLLRRQGRKE